MGYIDFRVFFKEIFLDFLGSKIKKKNVDTKRKINIFILKIFMIFYFSI